LLICYQQKPRVDVTIEQVRKLIAPPPPPKQDAPKELPPAKINYDKQQTSTPQVKQRRRDVDRTTGRPIEFNEATGVWEFATQ
jgi:hypothetical protein